MAWHIELYENSRKFADFMSEGVSYVLNPFGDKTASGSFRRAFRKILGYLAIEVKFFLDDILIYHKTLNELLSLLQGVLAVLCK